MGHIFKVQDLSYCPVKFLLFKYFISQKELL